MQEHNLELIIPETHPCYADHFPGNPLVPGALLLQWIFTRLGTCYPDISITGVKSAKFLHAVRPGNLCRLKTAYKPELSALSVECLCDGKAVCVCKLSVGTNRN
jgi:3-hydroxymyristoyl/3-hydroxydecanoyl-(acyl carrier protein) dehydratase